MYVGVFKPHMNCEMCCNNDFVFVLSCTYSHSFSDWNLHEKFLWLHETSHAIYDMTNMIVEIREDYERSISNINPLSLLIF